VGRRLLKKPESFAGEIGQRLDRGLEEVNERVDFTIPLYQAGSPWPCLFCLQLIAAYLPAPSLITEPARIA
jgi:hypothetical protein